MNDGVIIIGLAFLLDLAVGDPSYSCHPVRLAGKWIYSIEKLFFKLNFKGIFSGIVFWFFTVTPLLLGSFAVFYILDNYTFHALAIGWEIFIVYSCFAFRDMIDHVKPIYAALEQNDVELARKKLRLIVGRDTDSLKKEAIIRATIESISESFVDGFLSPMFWYVLGIVAGIFADKMINSQRLSFADFWGTAWGPGAMLMFRVTNTLDSMVGYQNEKYEKFGKFSARVDDLMNFMPARLSLFFILPGIILTRTKALSAIKIFLRDRLKSKSPNAAHSMSVFAGALEISLGGPALYNGELLNKPVIGDLKTKIKSVLIINALKIFFYSGASIIVILLTILYKPF
jgi:adenosylcobinamide-phosphate synthase